MPTLLETAQQLVSEFDEQRQFRLSDEINTEQYLDNLIFLLKEFRTKVKKYADPEPTLRDTNRLRICAQSLLTAIEDEKKPIGQMHGPTLIAYARLYQELTSRV
jgi:hypothetical protein